MPHTPITVAELLKINDMNNADIDVSDLLQDAPVLAALPATTASNGDLHKYTKQTTAPTVGFRAENDGRDHDFTVSTQVTVTCKILDASFHVDRANAQTYKDGADALIAWEARNHLRAAFKAAESQLFYGTASPGDAGGFAGLLQSTALDAIADAMVIDGGGSTADVQTSVYLLNADQDLSGVTVVLGNDGMMEIGDRYEAMVDGATGSFDAWVVPILAYMGLQTGSIYSAGRIANVESSLTDDMIYSAIAEFPTAKQPDYICMNRKGLKLLRDSRTATNATGVPAPRPTEVEGIPIIVTDSLVSTEAVEV